MITFNILCRFTATKAFKLMLNEINDLAGQHEVIAENLSTAVVSDLNILVKSMRDDRRKVRKLYPTMLSVMIQISHNKPGMEKTDFFKKKTAGRDSLVILEV